MLEFEGVSIAYRVPDGRLLAVEGASASLPEGAIGALVGPSGCGKTSLVQAAAGLLKPAAGRVLVAGKELRAVRERTAVIFQDFGLLPWKTVEENAELPLLLRRIPRAERRRRVAPVLEELGLLPYRSFFPARLSGGMRQRVAVARALASDPDLLLMDEPFSSLDALTREGLQESLLSAARRRRMTVLIVTHSIEEAAFLSDRAYVMTGRAPGRVSALVEPPAGTAEDSRAAAAGGGQAVGGADQRGPAFRGPAYRGPAYRGSPLYFEYCVAIRRSLEAAEAG
ncbi:MAG TPA: ATP-binding cassette domain-containing protein, partial [Spirochaetia bacterium]|nr:ATP-binding cassette domain-containing protein [Spirochaetia bacterium]